MHCVKFQGKDSSWKRNGIRSIYGQNTFGVRCYRYFQSSSSVKMTHIILRYLAYQQILPSVPCTRFISHKIIQSTTIFLTHRFLTLFKKKVSHPKPDENIAEIMYNLVSDVKMITNVMRGNKRFMDWQLILSYIPTT